MKIMPKSIKYCEKKNRLHHETKIPHTKTTQLPSAPNNDLRRVCLHSYHQLSHENLLIPLALLPAIPIVPNEPKSSEKNSRLLNAKFSANVPWPHSENNSVLAVCGPELGTSSSYKGAFCTRSRKSKLDSSSLSFVSTSHFRSPVFQSFISKSPHFLPKKNNQLEIEDEN